MDNAIHFFDELKKSMQQVEQAIEDWDYQDFSPDKRRALLEEEVSNDVEDDRQPETGAMQHIQGSHHQLSWTGLSPEAALEDYDCDSTLTSHSSLGYESKMVIMSTPTGGIQGVPDADSLHRFVSKAQHMDPNLLAEAFAARLTDPASCWQTRSKALVLMQALTESSQPLAPHFLPALKHNATLMQQLDKLRALGHNHIARENARKALSLIQSNGRNAMLIAKEATMGKPHVHHVHGQRMHTEGHGASLASVRKKAPAVKRVVATTATAPPPPPSALRLDAHQPEMQKNAPPLQPTSPKIARAVLASWKRRNSQENPKAANAQDHPQLLGANIMTRSAGSPPSSSSISSRYQSGQLSAFTFIQS